MFTRMRQLFNTTAIRLALRYALLNMTVLALALAALFVLLNRYVDSQIESALRGEAALLAGMNSQQRADRIDRLIELRGEDQQIRYYRVETASGAVGNVAAWPEGLAADNRFRHVALRVAQEEIDALDGETQSLPLVTTSLPEGGRLLIAQAPGAIEDLREMALVLAAVILGLSALTALALGIALGKQWLARIEIINGVAGRIANGDYSQRVVSSGHGDEFDLLTGHLNAMLGRIETAIAGMREVSDLVAHDLRKPLARLKTRIEVVLARDRNKEAYRQALAETAEDADEIIRSFEALLSIARLEAGSEILSPEVIDVAEVVRRVMELYADEAEETGRPLVVETPEHLSLRGTPELLAHALANVLDNAFKYTAPDIPIEVRLATEDGRAVLTVVDHGPGISEADRPRLLQRFGRGDAARSQPGSGLGLALAVAVARAHGGALSLADTPGGGLTARLTLPCS